MRNFGMVVIAFFATGCILIETDEYEVYWKLKQFPDSFTTHFPTQFGRFVDGYSFLNSIGDDDDFGKSIYVYYNVFAEDSLEKYIENYSKFSKLESKKSFYLYKNRSQMISDGGVVIYNDSIPIPFPLLVDIHCSFRKNDTILRIPKDFDVYVLETKKGKFLADSLLINDSIVPEPWQHGMSRGVAISKKNQKVIAWLSIW